MRKAFTNLFLNLLLFLFLYIDLNIYTLDGLIEEKDGSKYLNVALTDYNNNVLKKYSKVWKGIKNQIVKINKGLGGGSTIKIT